MRVLRHEVPVDDRPHEVECGRIVHVDCRRADAVEVWALDEEPRWRHFLVVGTGHPFPTIGEWLHVGTALSPATPVHPRGLLVWHLIQEFTPTGMEPS